MSYQMIVGLGNPGSSYAGTRHNAGFRVVDALALTLRASAWQKQRSFKSELATARSENGEALYLLKPGAFMNASGSCVQSACSFFKIPPENVVVIYDETNLELGEVKLSMSGSAGGHNGLADILARLAPRFARLRIGIGQKPVPEMDLADYVLGRFTAEEEALFASSMERYLDALRRLLRDGPERAMNFINQRKKIDDSKSI